MHGRDRNNVSVYTDKSGLYQSLIDLSVLHYVRKDLMDDGWLICDGLFM